MHEPLKNRTYLGKNCFLIFWALIFLHPKAVIDMKNSLYWGQNKDAKWLKNLQSEVIVAKQERIDITKENSKKILGRMPNWKSLGPELVQGFWLNNFSSLHGRVRSQLKECLDSGFVPSWLTKGRTALLYKDKNKGNIASNYRPITCLPLMWKLLLGVIADQIYGHLDQQKLLSEEQRMQEKI